MLSLATLTRITWISVLLFPIILNGPKLLGLLNADPLLNYSYLRSQVVPGPLPVYPEHDPSVGVVFQPLGHRAAEEMIHGTLPWWNSLQGIGAPLAGAMSVGSFFPLIFLELLPNGQVVLDVAVQILAGVCMLLLARRLGLGIFAAGVGALLFELNGTIAWLNAGWCYPLPFLPLLVYGVELAVAPDLRERIGGTIVVAIAIGLSISAAMIEVAYLDGLLALSWAVLRLIQTRRNALVDRILRLGLGGVLGLLLAAPLLIAFADFLNVSYVGLHAGDGPSGADIRGLTQLILPYFLGEVFYNDSGYGGIFLFLLAVCGLFGPHLRGVRILVGGWIVVAISATVGVPYLSSIFEGIPGVRYTAYWRYLDGSWEFALALLAAMFIYDIGRPPARRAFIGRCVTATAVVSVTLMIGILSSLSTVSDSFSKPAYAISCWSSVAWCVVAIGLLCVATLCNLAPRLRTAILACTVLVEATANYAIPMLGFPRHVTVSEGSIGFLHDHLGLDRVFSVNTLKPNYGTYFHVAALNDAELPVAKTWADYILTHLDTSENQGWLNGRGQGELGRNVYSYEDLGMKYVMTTSGTLPYENFNEPIDTTIAARPIPIIDTGGGIDVRLPSAPFGSLGAVSIVQGNYGGTADGRLHVHVCSGRRCVEGYRSFSQSLDNAAFWVNLERPLDVVDGVISMKISQDHASVNGAVWLYGRTKASTETVSVAGRQVQGYVAAVRLAYDSLVSAPIETSFARRSVPDDGLHETLIASDLLPTAFTEYVTAIIISGADIDAKFDRLRACSLGRCEDAVELPTHASRQTDHWYALSAALRARNLLTLALGRATESHRRFGIRLAISTERPVLVYHDAVADLFAMPHPASYFEAPNCVLISHARERVTATCRTASVLTRRELYLPGWSAMQNGRSIDVRPMSTIFQSVSLPAGQSSVDFSFEPPLMSFGYSAFTIAILTLGYQILAYARFGKSRTVDR